MAKQKRSVSDLDEELEALEAELAALEGKPRKAKKAKPAPEPTAPAQPEAPAPESSEPAKKRGRFALSFGRKKESAEVKAETPAPAAADAAPERVLDAAPEVAPAAPVAPEAPPVEQAPAPSSSAAPERPPQFDATLWRHEDGAWIRTVPDTPVPVIRRVVDEQGELVREEPATQADVDEVTGVKAERGLGRFLRRKA